MRELVLALPDVEEGTTWGVPAFKIHGKLIACPAIHRSAEPGTLVVQVGFEERDGLIADDPDIYYLKEHYVNYPGVLVRMSRISREALKGLLQMGWRFAAASGKRRARPRRPRQPLE